MHLYCCDGQTVLIRNDFLCTHIDPRVFNWKSHFQKYKANPSKMALTTHRVRQCLHTTAINIYCIRAQTLISFLLHNPSVKEQERVQLNTSGLRHVSIFSGMWGGKKQLRLCDY